MWQLIKDTSSCSASTQPQISLAKESEMETPKEIFLKDYKMPDYYFSKVGMYAIDYRKIYIDDNLHMEQSY